MAMWYLFTLASNLGISWILIVIFKILNLLAVQATVTVYNFQQYRHIQAPGWTLGWSWAKREVIWGMNGGQTTEQGDCSKFKGTIPHCCKKTPSVVDLLPGSPYNQQIANCCRGGVLNSWAQDPATAVSAFQLTVGQAGTTNKTVRVPKNFTLKAPGPGYTCSPAKIVKPTRFIGTDKRRVTQALSKLLSSWTLPKQIWLLSEMKTEFWLFFFCCDSDLECNLHILAVLSSENTNLLCISFIVL